LIYIERGSVNIWKKNVLEDLKVRELEFLIVGDFLTKLKKNSAVETMS